MRTLSGEHPHRATVVLADGSLQWVVALGEGPQAIDECTTVLGDHGLAYRTMATAARQGVGEITQHQIGVGSFDPVGHARRGLTKSFGGRGRDRKHQFRGGRVDRARAGVEWVRCLLEHSMHIGAGHAIGGDGRAPRGEGFVDRPLGGLLRDEQTGFDRGKMVGKLVEVQVFRHDPVVNREHGLHQAQHAGRGLGVTKIALDARQRASSTGAVHRGHAGVLDGVADRRSGAVCLDHADGGSIDAGRGQGGTEHRDLGVTGRGQDVVGATVLVGSGSTDHREHPVAIALGVVEALEHDDAAAFGPDEAVGFDVEGMAAPGRRQHSLAGRRGVQARIEHQHHATGQGHVGFAVVQASAGLMHGDHARRAGGVDGQGRTMQSQRVGDAARGHAEGVAGERIGLVEGAGVTGDHRIVIVGHADEDTG